MKRIAGLVVLLVAAPAAWSHAVLEQVRPPVGSSVPQAGFRVLLRFNSRIDVRRSRLAIIANGREVPLALAAETMPNSMEAEIKGAKAGPCRLRWQVLASDGHISRGEILFQVK